MCCDAVISFSAADKTKQKGVVNFVVIIKG